jgi:hypothetical protein
MHLRGFITTKITKKGKYSSIFIESNGRILDWGHTIGLLNNRYADTDGFLYLYVGRENAF